MAKGRYGIHGGQYIPETLMNEVNKLEEAYEFYKKDEDFNKELDKLLREYAGRPSLLYYAERMTKDLGGAKIYFKREDLTMFGGMNGYTPTLDSSKEYLKIEETSSTLWKGVAQDITLQENKKYKVSTVIFTKDKSLLTDGVGLTIKGVRTSDSTDIEFGASYLNPSDIKDYYGKEISFILDTSNLSINETINVIENEDRFIL